MDKQRGWSFLETLIVAVIALIGIAICGPLLSSRAYTYTIKTPTETFSDTHCYAVGGGMQCDRAYYGGDIVVTAK